MQAQCNHHEECQWIWICHASTPHPCLPAVAAVSDDSSSIDSLSHGEMSEWKGRIWTDHPKVVDDSNCDFDSISFGSTLVDPDPFMALERGHCESPMVKFWCHQ